MFIHVYFTVKLVIKRKGWSCSLASRTAVRTEASVYWNILAPHQKASNQYLLSEYPEKMERFVRYTCVPNQKTRTEIFGAYMCTVIPLMESKLLSEEMVDRCHWSISFFFFTYQLLSFSHLSYTTDNPNQFHMYKIIVFFFPPEYPDSPSTPHCKCKMHRCTVFLFNVF